MNDNVKIANELVKIAKSLMADDAAGNQEDDNIGDLVKELMQNKSALAPLKNKKFKKYVSGQLAQMTVLQALETLVNLSKQK